jgi:antitoxin component YwqK of YwqJK toxin-antitoxin module
MKILFSILASVLFYSASSQKIEMWLDSSFRHVKSNPYYYAVNEDKGDSGWFLQAWYIKDKTLAYEAWFEDKNADKPNGHYSSFYPNRRLKTEGDFIYGKKEGPWVTYNIDGMMTDSSNYYDGLLSGVQMKWHPNGILSDSLFHQAGNNATVVKWNDEGYLISAGMIDIKGKKSEIWNYYNTDGIRIGSEHFSNGERVKIVCYDSLGQKLPDDKCADHKVHFPGDDASWLSYFKKTFRESSISYNGLPEGKYVVKVAFTVDEKGNLADIRALTKNGYGLEDELLRVFQKSPTWIPTMVWGRAKATKLTYTLHYYMNASRQYSVMGFMMIDK